MKKSFIAGIIVFWTLVTALLAASFVVYEDGKVNALSDQFEGTEAGSLDTQSGVEGAFGESGSPSDPLLAESAELEEGLSESDSTVSGGTVVEYSTELRTVEKTQYMSAAIVAQHKTAADCWMIIEQKVYDVTDYIPFHPGGQDTVIDNCGTDATSGFNNRDGQGTGHSASASAMLVRYFKAAIGDPWGTVSVTEEVQVAKQVQEGQGSAQEASAASPGSSAQFALGSQIQTTDNVRVRKSASVGGTLITTASVGSQGVLTDGPTYSDGYWWYLVEYADGTKGWTVEDYMTTHVTQTSSTADAVVADPTDPDTPAELPTDPGTETCTSFTYNSWNSCQSNSTQSRTVKSSSPSGCTGGSPEVLQSCTYTPPSQPSGGITTADVATHNSSNDCWLIISDKVYDVTQYVPFHPGGQSRITNNCGTESTALFTSSAGQGHNHSSSATNLLQNYYVGDLQTAVSCTSFNYSSWGDCQSNDTQTRTVTSSSPSGCTGGSPVTSQSCTYVPPAGTPLCTSFTYSSWGTCQSNDTQTRTVLTSSPSGCEGGGPVTSQSCTYVAPADTTAPTVVIVNPSNGAVVSGSLTIQATANDAGGIDSVEFLIDSQSIRTDSSSPYSASLDTSAYSDGSHTIEVIATDTAGNTKTNSVSVSINNTPPSQPSGGITTADVATHNSSNDCWLIISDKVYDVTQYVPFHPGGQSRITNNCGTESTALFTSSAGQGHNHSSSATNLLQNYYVGDLQTAVSCTSFNYSSWGDCQSNDTQTRTVTSSSPSGCTGGSPVTSQSCTYVPPAGTPLCTSFTYSSWGTCQSNDTQTRTVLTSSPSGCEGGGPVTSQSCTYVAPDTPETHIIEVSRSGGLTPSSLTISVGDSINFVGVNLGDEVIINFSPSTISRIKIDHERTTALRTFDSAGTWTFGNGGSVTVE